MVHLQPTQLPGSMTQERQDFQDRSSEATVQDERTFKFRLPEEFDPRRPEYQGTANSELSTFLGKVRGS